MNINNKALFFFLFNSRQQINPFHFLTSSLPVLGVVKNNKTAATFLTLRKRCMSISFKIGKPGVQYGLVKPAAKPTVPISGDDESDEEGNEKKAPQNIKESLFPTPSTSFCLE